MRTLLSLAVLALLCGCAAVYVTQPIGEKPSNLSAEEKAWDGTWVHENGALTVSVADARMVLCRSS